MQLKFKIGDMVRWQYRHSLNSRSYTMVEKTGVFYGLVKHTIRHGNKPQMAAVKFKGNKRVSLVPLKELI